eukprot:1005037-Pyramimonas_sp.AAC.1
MRCDAQAGRKLCIPTTRSASTTPTATSRGAHLWRRATKDSHHHRQPLRRARPPPPQARQHYVGAPALDETITRRYTDD